MPRKKNEADVAEQTRARIARCLPDAIERAVDSYRTFSSDSDEKKSKNFSAYHTACKAAIAHIELLLKLANWAELPRDSDDESLSVLMADAQAELDRHKEEDFDE